MPMSKACLNNIHDPYCDIDPCDCPCHHPDGVIDGQETLFDGPTNESEVEILLPDLPARPYRQDGLPSAGWSGTDTSKEGERARGRRQVQVLSHVTLTGRRGTTAHEAEEALGLDHGKVSGPLSVLHRKVGALALLKEKRDGFRVYVTVDNVEGRDHD